MKRTLFIFSLFIAACSGTEPKGKITGAYATEYSFEQKNIQTDKVVGKALIRDTFYIKAKEQGFEVQEKKWRKNDYDNNGWQEQVSIDKRRPVYQVRFDKTDNTLISENGFYPPMIIDIAGKQLFLSDKKDKGYTKIAAR